MIELTYSVDYQNRGKVECLVTGINCSPEGMVEAYLSVESEVYHILCGSLFGKNYLCIPNKKWCFEFADYDDAMWNYDSIYQATKNDLEAIILSIMLRGIPMLRLYYDAWHDRLDT